jgi:hypothetical protein
MDTVLYVVFLGGCMATSTATRLVVLFVVVAAGAYFAPKLVDGVGDVISDVTGANDAVTVGEGDTAFMVAANAQPKVAACDPREVVSQRNCGGLPVLTVNAAKMPFIARNTRLAWEDGQPAILTMDRRRQPVNRDAACGGFAHRHPPPVGSCDEYPMAVTVEGGAGARIEEVPLRENSCQGGSYGRQYPKDGTRFLVVIVRPELIATRPFTGVDIAKERGLC